MLYIKVHFLSQHSGSVKVKMLYIYSFCSSTSSTSFRLCCEISECPNWYHCAPRSHHCLCGPTLQGGIMCSDYRVYVRIEIIMTWDTATNQTIAAYSKYMDVTTIPPLYTHGVYTLMPNDSQDLNETMCASYSREGFLCEDCVPGYSPTAYIYSPKCMDCKQRSTYSAIAIFLTLKLTPITVMFILLILIPIALFRYVLYCQALVITVAHLKLYYQLFLHELHCYNWVLQASLFPSVWVADFSLLYI